MRLKVARFAVAVLAMGLAPGGARTASAQSDESPLQLVVEAGRPLRVAIDKRVRLRKAGQSIGATVIEPVYAYDRIVVPPGTRVIGHVSRLEPVSRKTRLAAIARGDFTPLRYASLQFDQLVFSDGRTLPIQTSTTTGAEMVLKVADAPKGTGVAARAKEEIARRAKQTVDVAKAPGKMERLKDAAILSLPYHPQFLRKGTVYSARLAAPLEFGTAPAVERAPPGTAPDPESLLNARLVTPLDSATATRGTPIEAVLTQPVFSADRRLIFPEGARVTGEVTFARPRRRFHRHGQLRFLFQSVHVRGQSERLLASLYSVESSAAGRVAIDDEGGASSTSSPARFAAPGLAALALAGSLHGRLDYDTDGAGPEMNYGGVGSTNVGGFIGFGALGAGLAQISRPLTMTLTVAGLARTTYSAVFGKGRNVSFPADTSIQIKLAPAAPRGND
jgi:hypothetical protein